MRNTLFKFADFCTGRTLFDGFDYMDDMDYDYIKE